MSKILKWSKKEYKLHTRIITTLSAGPIFLVLIPLVVIWLGPKLDAYFGIPTINVKPYRMIFIILISIPGYCLALWSIITQIKIGRGTPLPMMATQNLLIIGPFKYSRNPMSLGTVLMYLGISLYAGSFSSIEIACFLSFILLLYLKKIEEKELAERFGEEYLEYKKSIPFIIPKIEYSFKKTGSGPG